MRTRLLSLGLLLLAGTVAGLAAPSPTPSPSPEAPPSPPFVANAPASSQWTVTYAPKSPESKNATPAEVQARKMRQRYSPLVVSTHTIKAPGKLVVYTTYEADLKSEAWLANGYMYGLPLREDESVRIEAKKPGDFPETSWVSAENFHGTVDLKKRKVHLYEMELPGGPDASPTPEAPSGKKKSDNKPDKADKKAMRRVYVDAETKLPVQVETGSAVMTYEFGESPETFPEVNARVAELIKQSKE